MIKRAFLSMDRILMEELSDKSGTTCTSLLITKNHFLFINCGDSRGFLSRSKGMISNKGSSLDGWKWKKWCYFPYLNNDFFLPSKIKLALHSFVKNHFKDNSSNVHFSTLDHKPTNPEERQRIQNAGGVVLTQRINGSLAVSRALGDFDYK